MYSQVKAEIFICIFRAQSFSYGCGFVHFYPLDRIRKKNEKKKKMSTQKFVFACDFCLRHHPITIRTEKRFRVRAQNKTE